MEEELKPKKKKISKSDAIAELWEKGNLSYKLRDNQKLVYDGIRNANKKVNPIVCSRRFGKTYTALVYVFEECLKNPNTIVKFACATQKQVFEILDEIVPHVCEGAPSHLVPEWLEAKKRYVFSNGSKILLSGIDNDRADNLRGGSAHICIVDEAAFCDSLENVIKKIFIPSTLLTKGKIIVISTPNSKDPQHYFNVHYIQRLEDAGQLKKFTVYDNPMVTKEMLDEIIAEYPLGVEDPEFRCEFLCELTIDQTVMVLPELNAEKEKEIVFDTKKPPFFHSYVSMDVGFRDLTGALFAYVDYDKSALIIADELVINGPTLTTDYLAESIKTKEDDTFKDSNGYFKVEPSLRVSDNNNLILLNDLLRLHALNFSATSKDNKEAQINELRLLIKQNRLIISPKCKNLLFHMKNAKWDKNRKQFTRLKDSPDGKLRGGHADLLDALIYLVRNINIKRNPYPENWGELTGPNVFKGDKTSKNSKLQEFMDAIMGLKGKK